MKEKSPQYHPPSAELRGKKKLILWFKETSIKDVPLVGGKNASLGEMFSQLAKKGINVPDGFALTTNFYWKFLEANGLDKVLKGFFKEFNPKSIKSIQETGKKCRAAILKGKFPDSLKQEILKAYLKLSQKYGANPDVAVRTSGVAEDRPNASFAGQFETYLNVRGEEELLKAAKKSIVSTFTDRAIAYREEKKIGQMEFGLSVGVQKMVRSDLASSGIIFTLDTETGFSNVVLINSIWGVGEMIVKGKITPDQFYVFKPTLKQGYRPIIVKNLGRKNKKYIFAKNGGLEEADVFPQNQLKFSLSDEDVLTLAKWAVLIEEHYGKPQDIEWAKDGKTGKLFIVQSRPETVYAVQNEKTTYEEYQIKTKKSPILTGIAIGNKIGIGKIRLISDVSKISGFQKGEVLLTKMTDPDWVPIMRLASAIITDEGGKTCFAGDTKILTNKGFLSIKEIAEIFNSVSIEVLSLNRESLKIEWKRVVNAFKRKSSTIEINVSQTGRMKDNTLRTTPDHKFITFNNRCLISEEIQNIIRSQRGILSLQKIPSKDYLSFSPKIGYLLGAISTDGHVRIDRTKAQIHFVQKPTVAKKDFIEKVKKYFADEYRYDLHLYKKHPSQGIIRGKIINGSAALDLRCYNKKIATDIVQKQRKISDILIKANKEFLLNFIAGAIDGDGTYNEKANRINIFCSKQFLLEAITITCLRLGVSFQVVKNRNIHNIQIVDGIEEILEYTSRVKGCYRIRVMGTRFFKAKQLLEDIIRRINYRGRILIYVKNNLLIDAEKIRNYVIPMIKGQSENHALTKIIESNLKMLRVDVEGKAAKSKDVYNIEVENNHNYVVFTRRYTPIIVENCHAAIVSRELGVPCIVGAGRATKIFKNGETVTVDCTQGSVGRIYQGEIPFILKKYDLKKIPKLKTKIMINIGAPDIAFKTSFLPNAGVGLARIEFILADKIRIHPLALYHYGKGFKDRKTKSEIGRITSGFKDKKQYFIDKLAEGISQIASAFYPKPVIVRLSDFKSNEYAELLGGSIFEPKESNPMLGWRGASRYYDEKFKPAFKMECQAIKKAREVFGLKNIWVMVPFCRTVEEGKTVLEEMRKNGLGKTGNGLKVIVMCEIPSNVVLADKFLDIFDGMSIGSNDLTQLVLGLDRDSALVAKVGDERNEAVKEMVKKVIEVCKRRKKYVGICGEAASIPEFAKFLINCEIESLSVNSDSVIKTILIVADEEKKLKKE